MRKNQDNEIIKSIEKLQKLLEELRSRIERYHRVILEAIFKED